MESITELRKICQGTRPSIFTDFLSRFYYKVAIYFTWVCLLFGLSANQVTVLSGVIAFLGGIFLGSNNYTLILIGVLFFHLFAILDMSDGEVARYRKQGGVAGHYLDWYMHFISSSSFMLGLFLASYNHLTNPLILIFGLLGLLFPVLDKSVQTSGWTVICWTRLRDLKNNNGQVPVINKTSPESHKSNILIRRIKFLFLAPLQDHWAPLIMLFVVMVDGFLRLINFYIDFNYRLFWLLYVGVLAAPYLWLRVRHMIKSHALSFGYKRLIAPDRPIEFPRDDFLD